MVTEDGGLVIDMIALASLAGLVGVWLIYPLVLVCLTALKQRRTPTRVGTPPRVSIVIATHDSLDAVQNRVANCLTSDYPKDLLEVVVAIDSRGEIPTARQISESSQVCVVRGHPPGGKAVTLNAGAATATGDVIVFADTHQRFAPETVPRLVEALQSPGVGAATGRLELRAGRPGVRELYWRYERWLRQLEGEVHSPVGVTGAVYAIRRELWKPLPAHLILDDLHVPMRLVLDGWFIRFVCDAPAFDTRSPTPVEEYRRKARTLTGVLQLCVWLPGVLIPFRNRIWIQFVIHKLLRLLTPFWTLLIVGWATVATGRLLGPHLPLGVIAVTGLVTWIVVARHRIARYIRHVVAEFVMLQIAVVMALRNAAQGRWEVWRQ